MCGIAGILKKDGSLPSGEMLHSALLTMTLRGPDDEGIWNHGHVALGHRRLAVMDTTQAGHQPFCDPDRRYALVFNGEIFNHAEIRQSLIQEGISFLTKTDTEVLLHLLIHRGLDGLNETIGFFAFAFYDRKEDKLLLGRDRFGEKPLLYFEDDKTLLFGSTVKALIKLGVSPEIDQESLALFLQYTYVPEPRSMISGIKKLRPGMALEWFAGTSKIVKWYEPIIEHFAPSRHAEAKEQLRESLIESVRYRLISGVPIGSFLSGGIDSSIVSALAAKQTSQLKTYSIGFPDEPFYDESAYAEQMSRHIGSTHQTIAVTADDLLDEIPKVWDAMDEPFADSSAIAVHILTRLTKREITVALSGDGADELFAGYNKHEAFRRAASSSLSNTFIPIAATVTSWFPQHRNSTFGNRSRQLQRYAQGLRMPIKDRYTFWASFSYANTVDSLLNERFDTNALLANYTAGLREKDLNGLLLVDQDLVLCNDMLVKVDRMSMHNSLEVRPAFLDHRVVELGNSFPSEWKINSSGRKLILKETFADLLPTSLLNRSKKGFEVPLEKWLRGPLQSIVYGLLSEEELKATGLFDHHGVHHLLRDYYDRGQSQHTELVYALTTFMQWYKAILSDN